MDARTLPDLDQLDSQALKSLILTLHEQVFSNQQEILAQREQLASREMEIEHLKLLIAKLRRMQFGRSSEKQAYQIAQLELRLEELETRQKKETAVGEPSTPASTAVRRPTRRSRSLPDHLPREVRKCLPKQESCPAETMVRGDTRETLAKIRYRSGRSLRTRTVGSTTALL
jgi:transposase